MKRILSVLLILALLAGLVPALGEAVETGEAAEAPANSPASAYDFGSHVFFGRYEQDNDPDNGPEPIEWIVLDMDEAGSRALVISRYALDHRKYHDPGTHTSWEECTLRAWLNGEFFDSAFTPEEQAAVLLTHVENSHNTGDPKLYTKAGNDTEDRVFVLSYSEAHSLIALREGRMCSATAYAVARGADLSKQEFRVDDELTATWWLRSPGNQRDTACRIGFAGTVGSSRVSQTGLTVRPALWIDLTSVTPADGTAESEDADAPAEEEADTAPADVAPTDAALADAAPAEAAPAEAASAEAAPEDAALADAAPEDVEPNSPASAYVKGGIVVFGRYEQDNNMANGPEAVEWIVLEMDKKAGRALLLSNHALDMQPYQRGGGKVSWENSTLRPWLNGEFLESAFTAEEQAAILAPSKIDDKKHSFNKTGSGADKLFILSVDEAYKYMPPQSPKNLICWPTDYAAAKTAGSDSSTPISWWMRTPGGKAGEVRGIGPEGYSFNGKADREDVAVRPALWVDLSAAALAEPEEEESLEETVPIDEAEDTDDTVGVGDIITFGTWEQDTDKRNGPEPIEWIVLEVSGSKALVISRLGLVHCQYSQSSGGQTWANSTLRGTLNHDFYSTAFTAEEKNAILMTSVHEGKNQQDPAHPSTRIGSNTKDRIFILSYAEIIRYFPTAEERKCYVTEYTRKNANHSKSITGENYTCWYWLRNPAYDNNAGAVDWDGTIDTCFISHKYGVARPCCWVDLTKLPEPAAPDADEAEDAAP